MSSGKKRSRPRPTGSSEYEEVVFSVPWIIEGVDSPQDAINIAVSEVGTRLSELGASIGHVDIDVQHLTCANCTTDSHAILLVSGTALVGLTLTIEVRATSDEEAERTARRRIGPKLPDTPLTPV